MLGIRPWAAYSRAARQALVVAVGFLAVCRTVQIVNSADHYQLVGDGRRKAGGSIRRERQTLGLWSTSPGGIPEEDCFATAPRVLKRPGGCFASGIDFVA